MTGDDELQKIAINADNILKEELSKHNIDYDLAETRVYDIETVGVQGDKRTYLHPVEIELNRENNIVWDTDFLSILSNRITNEVVGVNRVVFVTK